MFSFSQVILWAFILISVLFNVFHLIFSKVDPIEHIHKEKYIHVCEKCRNCSVVAAKSPIEEWDPLSLLFGPQSYPSPYTSQIIQTLDKQLETSSVLNMASEYVYKEIERIQNPKNCSNAKFMYCSISNNCGAGCTIHQLLYCFYVAFATQRTMVIGGFWHYLSDCPNPGWWNCVFEPVSSCPVPTKHSAFPVWTPKEELSGTKWTQIDLYLRSDMYRGIKWATTDGDHWDIPMWLPPAIHYKISKHHYMAKKWLVGHLATWILRLNQDTLQFLHKRNAHIESVYNNKTQPIIGIHVRRTDKVAGAFAEAKLRPLDEYMAKVEAYYKEVLKQDFKQQSPIIYLATDDPGVYHEAINNYPNCTWLVYKTEFGMISGENTIRTNLEGAFSLLSDVHYLSRADYLIGTFSSQVSRLANEISEVYSRNGKRNYVSLDHVWYFP